MSLNRKFFWFLLLGAICPLAITGWIYFVTKIPLEDTALRALEAIRESKKHQIEDAISKLRNQVLSLGENPKLREVLERFSNAFDLYPQEREGQTAEVADRREALTSWYRNEFLLRLQLVSNSNPELGILVPSPDRSICLQQRYITDPSYAIQPPDGPAEDLNARQYDQIHSEAHPWLKTYTSRHGFTDLYLLDTHGNIVYSAKKNIDFARSVRQDFLRNSGLHRAYRRGMESSQNPGADFIDFQPYLPVLESQAAFISSPVRGLGVLVIQVPIAHINTVASGGHNWKREGLGHRGQSFILGADAVPRNSFRSKLESTADLLSLLNIKESSQNQESMSFVSRASKTSLPHSILKPALEHQTRTLSYATREGTTVLCSYTPLDIPGLDWVLVTVLEKSEALWSSKAFALELSLVGLIFTFLFLVLHAMFSKQVLTPVMALLGATRQIRKGNLGVRLKISSKDELGELQESFNLMSHDLQETQENLEDEIALCRAVEQELMVSEGLLQRVLESIPVAIYWKDSNSNFLGANGHFAAMTGFKTGKDLLELSDSDLNWAPENNKKLCDAESHIIVFGKPMHSATVLLQLDSSTAKVRFHITTVSLLDENGRAMGVMGILERFTNQKSQGQSEVGPQSMEALKAIDSSTRVIGLPRMFPPREPKDPT